MENSQLALRRSRLLSLPAHRDSEYCVCDLLQNTEEGPEVTSSASGSRRPCQVRVVWAVNSDGHHNWGSQSVPYAVLMLHFLCCAFGFSYFKSFKIDSFFFCLMFLASLRITTQFLILFCFVCMGVLPLCMSVHYTHAIPEKVWRGYHIPCKLVLHMAESSHVGAQNWTQILWKRRQFLICSVISPDLISLTFIVEYCFQET